MTGEHPWIAGDLVIVRAVLADVEAHAKESYPSEACGYLSGPAADVRLVDSGERQPNLADRYHKQDPERFPRTSQTYFILDGLKGDRALEHGEREGRPVKVIYHSHCDAGAYFSAEDAATFASGGVLQRPCAFLVVSVQKGEVVDRKLWAHVPGTNDFREARFEVR